MALRAYFVAFLLMLCFFNVFGVEMNRDKGGFINRLGSGMQFAKDFLGSESVALKVAEFVVRAFQTANSPSATKNKLPSDLFTESTNNPSDKWTNENGQGNDDDNFNNNVHDGKPPMAALKQLVKLFGLQPSQITAVAVNALLFVAQMISTFLSGPQRPSTKHRFEDSTSWILNKQSRRLQAALAAARNLSLPETIDHLVTEQHSYEETTCIRLLICKLTPYVTKMQQAVFGQRGETFTNSTGAGIMYQHLPSKDEITERNQFCEKQHIDCNLNEL